MSRRGSGRGRGLAVVVSLLAAVGMSARGAPAYAGGAAGAGSIGSAGAAGSAGSAGRAQVVFRIMSPQIVESSSLAVSTVDPGLVYTTNDSGDGGTVYTLDARTGTVVGRTTLAGFDLLDVEAITAVSDGSLIVADIGDNDADHSTADLYRIDQPGRGDSAVTPERVDLTYVGGPRDAESLLYDVETGRAFVVSKLIVGARVYATPPHVFDLERAQLRPVADAPPLATDATFLPGGDFAVVRTYTGATVYAYPSWEEVSTFDLPSQPQGESITAPPSGGLVWVGSEGTHSRVLAVPLPKLSEPGGSSGSSGGTTSPGDGSGVSSTTDDAAGSEDRSTQDLARIVFVVSSSLLLVVLLGLVALVVIRHRRP